ncbi:ribosomal RNA-processing protein 7-domain-containing protein [Gloeopeniophorella convolvens]|nr:ribosomal RNA-processing protein 7-domain-containing protein [Gloeopeniophorella convolvens]
MPSKTTSGAFASFSPLPVQYGPDSQHIIYVRVHVGSSSNGSKAKIAWPEDRTLFMVNVPPDATEREIVLLFKSCGTVEAVVFDTDNLGLDGDEESDADVDANSGADGSVASTSQSPSHKKRKLAAAMQALHPGTPSAHQNPGASRAEPRPWPIGGDRERPRGLAHYIAQYESTRPPLEAVRAHADSAIARFDFDLAARKAALRRESKYKKGEALVDEDGFTLVVRGGAYGQAVGGGVGVASRRFMDEHVKGAHGKDATTKRKRHKEGKEKTAFYAFQIHEKKRNAILELKRKWEQDKAAVEKLKSSRKFKPY